MVDMESRRDEWIENRAMELMEEDLDLWPEEAYQVAWGELVGYAGDPDECNLDDIEDDINF